MNNIKNILFYSLIGFLITNPAVAKTLEAFRANNLTSNNILTMQHSIMFNAIHNTEGFSATTYFAPKTINGKQTDNSDSIKNPRDLYGKMPLYGEMKYYGEYGDDGTVFQQGRSGGDSPEFGVPHFNAPWISWQHFGDDIKFNNYDKTNSEYDLIMIGVSGREKRTETSFNKLGFFAGYTSGAQGEKTSAEVSENGGYIGVYNGYKFKNFIISGLVDAGMLHNSVYFSNLSDDTFTNFWVGASLNMMFNIALDDTFFIQPGLYAGYTWIKSDDYTSIDGKNVSNSNVSALEITPTLRMIKDINGKGWFGFAQVKHAMMIESSSPIQIGDTFIESLPYGNYTEYGIGVEKVIDNFNFSVNINRRDGLRYGWGGGFNIKYIF